VGGKGVGEKLENVFFAGVGEYMNYITTVVSGGSGIINGTIFYFGTGGTLAIIATGCAMNHL